MTSVASQSRPTNSNTFSRMSGVSLDIGEFMACNEWCRNESRGLGRCEVGQSCECDGDMVIDT